MSQIRLSICIATYNRSAFIGETLESIIPQLTDEVELVLVDGASTDDTEQVVGSYAQRCPQLKYTRLPSKGGVDQDYCKAVELADGEYCWLFTDDDLLMPGAVASVLRQLDKGYSLIVVNAQLMSADLSRVVEKQRLEIHADTVCTAEDLEGLFDCAVVYLSFIGGVVVNRALWMEREKERYFGIEFIHVGVIFQMSLPAPALVTAEPYIMIRMGNYQWSSRAVDIWMRKWPNLLDSFENIPKRTRHKFLVKTFSQKVKRIMTLRAARMYSLQEYRAFFSSPQTSLLWKTAAFCVAVTPVSVVSWIRSSFIGIKRMAKEGKLFSQSGSFQKSTAGEKTI